MRLHRFAAAGDPGPGVQLHDSSSTCSAALRFGEGLAGPGEIGEEPRQHRVLHRLPRGGDQAASCVPARATALESTMGRLPNLVGARTARAHHGINQVPEATFRTFGKISKEGLL